jgi:hypothetical protein
MGGIGGAGGRLLSFRGILEREGWGLGGGGREWEDVKV